LEYVLFLSGLASRERDNSLMNASYIGYVLEKSTIPIEERISRVVTERVKEICCQGEHCCIGDEFCGVARSEYKMLYVKEWENYAKGN
jgi:hypothetical protein